MYLVEQPQRVRADQTGVDRPHAWRDPVAAEFLFGRQVEPTRAKALYIADRLAFLERFHAYVQDNPGGEPQLWSTWLAEQP